MGFTKLPFAVILEICSYLDVESLIAVADVSLLSHKCFPLN
jgi:F-box domain